MTMDRLINLLVTITLIEMMISIGLGVTIPELLRMRSDRRLLVMAMIANYVCVPAATVGLLWLFQAPPMVCAGFLIAAVCPGAPYAAPFTSMAKGNTAVSVGLMVLLAGSSAILAPLLLRLLLPLLSGDQPLKIDALKIVTTLLVTQLLPLIGGLAIRHWRQALALVLQKPARQIAALLNLIVLVLIVVAQYRSLAEIRMLAFLGMSLLLIVSLASGWLLGGPSGETRKAMAISTAVRNIGVALVIATASFPGTAAVTAALAFGLFQTLAVALVAAGWGRIHSSHAPVAVANT
jgi:BASS family bile acid:Na+ symporter